MSSLGESVFAVLTPAGRGGIAVIRCVGPGAEAALARCFRPAARGKLLPESGAILYGHIVDADDRPLDEILLARTGPEAFEVNCHGGPAAVKAVCVRLEALGLARVEAGRLLEIEGVASIEREARRALRETTTPGAARILLDQLNGALAAAIGRAQSAIESGRAGDGLAVLSTLLERWRGCGRFLARPPRIAIAGLPNSGKSTLLNRLVGADRVITSPLPGTTRDTIAVETALAGLPVVLVDTAGLRAACSEVEREGVARARAELEEADLVVYLLDAAAGRRPEDDAIAALGERALAVWNKCDLAPGGMPRPPLPGHDCPRAAHACGEDAAGMPPPVSALTGEGVERLATVILARLGYAPTAPGEAVPFTVEQAGAIEAARDALAAGRADDAARAVEALLG